MIGTSLEILYQAKSINNNLGFLIKHKKQAMKLSKIMTTAALFF